MSGQLLYTTTAPLSVVSSIVQERDDRLLSGGNFFGREAVADRPLTPLPEPPEPEPLPGAMGAAGASGAGGANPILLKLPGKAGNKPPKPT